MTDARPQLDLRPSISRMAATMTAGLMVLTGIVFQLCELGLGRQSTNGFWFIPMILGSVWRLLAVHINALAITEILRFWPLLLISLGLAILMALKSQRREGA